MVFVFLQHFHQNLVNELDSGRLCGPEHIIQKSKSLIFCGFDFAWKSILISNDKEKSTQITIRKCVQERKIDQNPTH